MLPSWIRSSSGSPWPWYLRATETTSRRLAMMKRCRAASALRTSWRAFMIDRSERRRPARSRSSPSLPCSIRMASSTSSSLVRSGSRAAASGYSRRSSASSVPSGRAGSGMNSLSSSKPPYGACYAPGGLRDRSQSIGPRAYVDRPPRATGDHASPTPHACKGDAYVDLMEMPSIPRSVPVEASGDETPPDIHMTASAGMGPGHPARVRSARLGRERGGMDRDTLQDDLDLILERSRNDELPGEWDWEPPSERAPGRDLG